jgi:vacuolar-type H+-ATPase subunit I/STV1
MENLSAELIGALVLLVTNTAGLVKVWMDNAKTKADRVRVAQVRDADSLDLHDKVQKNTWEIDAIKADNGHRQQVMEQLQVQINALNTTLATTNVKLDTLVDAIKEMKGSSRKKRG